MSKTLLTGRQYGNWKNRTKCSCIKTWSRWSMWSTMLGNRKRRGLARLWERNCRSTTRILRNCKSSRIWVCFRSKKLIFTSGSSRNNWQRKSSKCWKLKSSRKSTANATTSPQGLMTTTSSRTESTNWRTSLCDLLRTSSLLIWDRGI